MSSTVYTYCRIYTHDNKWPPGKPLLQPYDEVYYCNFFHFWWSPVRRTVVTVQYSSLPRYVHWREKTWWHEEQVKWLSWRTGIRCVPRSLAHPQQQECVMLILWSKIASSWGAQSVTTKAQLNRVFSPIGRTIWNLLSRWQKGATLIGTTDDPKACDGKDDAP